MPELFGPARLRDRRHHPFHHQQPGRLHHQPAVRALLALPVGRRQGHPGADPPRQRRRSRGGHLLLQAGDRVPPAVQPRHRHRHVVLPPLRSQRGRRAELHPAADVRGDQDPSADQRGLRPAADRGRRGRPGVDRPADQGLYRPPRRGVSGGRFPICPTRPTGSRGAGPGSAGPTSRCSGAATRPPRSAKTRLQRLGQRADDGPRGASPSTRRCSASSTPGRRCSTPARASTGRPPKPSPSAA